MSSRQSNINYLHTIYEYKQTYDESYGVDILHAETSLFTWNKFNTYQRWH